MKYFTKEVQIALVAIVGIVVLFFGLQFLKGISLYSDDSTYYAKFDNINGLAANSAIYAGGYKVGTVKEVIFGYGDGRKTVAVLGLDKRMRVPKGSKATIESDMLGNLKLNLLLSDNPLETMQPGDTIEGSTAQGMLEKVGELMPAIERMVPKLDSITTSLNIILADPAILNSLHNVDKITSDLTVTTAELNKLVKNVNSEVPTMMARANGVLDNTETLTKNLSEIDVQATMDKVNATLSNVEQMSAKLNSNDGTLGLLMRDPELYRNLASTMRSADSLLIDLRSHPKRYVHFSLFGRKDK